MAHGRFTFARGLYPAVWMSQLGSPAAAASVAAPILRLWLLYWEACVGVRPDVVTGFFIYYSGDDGSNEAVHVAGGSTNCHILTELSPNINYMISVATTSSQHLRSDLVHVVNPIRIGKAYTV